jgi:hypothetical protein
MKNIRANQVEGRHEDGDRSVDEQETVVIVDSLKLKRRWHCSDEYVDGRCNRCLCSAGAAKFYDVFRERPKTVWIVMHDGRAADRVEVTRGHRGFHFDGSYFYVYPAFHFWLNDNMGDREKVHLELWHE